MTGGAANGGHNEDRRPKAPAAVGGVKAGGSSRSTPTDQACS